MNILKIRDRDIDLKTLCFVWKASGYVTLQEDSTLPCLSNCVTHFITDFYLRFQIQKRQNNWATQLEEKIEKYEHVFSLESSANGNIWETNQNKPSTTPVTKSLSSNHNIFHFYIIPRVFHQKKNPKHLTHTIIGLLTAMNRKFYYASWWPFELNVPLTCQDENCSRDKMPKYARNPCTKFYMHCKICRRYFDKEQRTVFLCLKKISCSQKAEKALKDAYRIKWQLAALKDEVKSVNVKIRIDHCLLG